MKGTLEGVVCVFRPAMFISEKVLRRWLGIGWSSTSEEVDVLVETCCVGCVPIAAVWGRLLEDP